MQPQPACPAENVLACRCPKNVNASVHSADASYYPRACLFRMGRRLFHVRMFDKGLGRHFWEMVVHNSPGLCSRTLYPDRLYHVQSLCFKLNAPVRGGAAVPMQWNIAGVSLVVHMWRIQRAVRAHLRRRWEKRALAVAMAAHHRLGQDSLLAAYPTELLRALLLF